MRQFLYILLCCTTMYAQYPQIANYFLDYSIQESELDSLALCDLLILDHEVGHSRPAILDSLRKRNPDITILAYIVSQEINDDALQWSGSLRASLYSGIKDEWWLRNSKGEQIQFWPGTHMLNVGAGVPEKSSVQWNRYLADFICDSLIAPGNWDGIYLDNCWHQVSWLDDSIDVNQDGKPDTPAMADSLWEVSMNVMLDFIRDRYPDIVLAGNGGYRYGAQLNGVLIETFPLWGEWFRLMDTYLRLNSAELRVPYNCINSNTDNSGEKSLRDMRFGLTSTLMGDGYFSYDFGADDHSQHWWFDEYDVDLGVPLESVQKIGETIFLDEDFSANLSMKLGSWNMSTAIKDTLGWHSAVHASVSNKEEWNEILTSTDTLSTDSIHVRGSFDVKVVEVTAGAELFAILRKGDDYTKDVSLLSVPVYADLDTTLYLYSDSLVVESGYRLIIGLRKSGSLLLDNVTLVTDETLIYSRKFANGIVLCNPSQRAQQVPLGRLYQKIKGTEDPVHNSGELVTTVLVPPRDGIVLQLPLSLLLSKAVNTSISALFSDRKLLLNGLEKGETYRYSLFSLQGKVLHGGDFQGSVVDVKGVASGHYILYVRSKEGSELHRQKLLIP